MPRDEPGRAKTKHDQSCFPAFWGPNFDWVPDQDRGGNLIMALRTKLLPNDRGKILLLPAWPKEWDVEFNLHTLQNTVVEGSCTGGKLTTKVTPEYGMDDIVRIQDYHWRMGRGELG